MMAANKLSTESIALTEKKMDMTLDDIIKMSKKAPFKGKQAPRTSNKSQGFLNDRVTQRNAKVQRFINSRSAIRQGVLAQRRTNFKGNHFPVTTEVARRAAVVPMRNRAVNPSKQRRFCLKAEYCAEQTPKKGEIYYQFELLIISSIHICSRVIGLKRGGIVELCQFEGTIGVEAFNGLKRGGIVELCQFEGTIGVEAFRDVRVVFFEAFPLFQFSNFQLRVAAIPNRTNAGDGNFTGKKQTVNSKQKPKTLDALFAGMKEQRMRTMSQQPRRGRGPSGLRRGRQNQQHRGWNPAASGGSAARYAS